MIKKMSKIENFPEWFDTDNYKKKALKGFSKKDWSEQFILRFFIQEKAGEAIERENLDLLNELHDLVCSPVEPCVNAEMYYDAITPEVKNLLCSLQQNLNILLSNDIQTASAVIINELLLEARNVHDPAGLMGIIKNCTSLDTLVKARKFETTEGSVGKKAGGRPRKVTTSPRQIHRVQKLCWNRIKQIGRVHFEEFFENKIGELCQVQDCMINLAQLRKLFPETAELFEAYKRMSRKNDVAVRGLNDYEAKILARDKSRIIEPEHPDGLQSHIFNRLEEDDEAIEKHQRNGDKTKIKKLLNQYGAEYEVRPTATDDGRILLSVSLDKDDKEIVRSLKALLKIFRERREGQLGIKKACAHESTFADYNLLPIFDLLLAKELGEHSISDMAIAGKLTPEEPDHREKKYKDVTKKWLDRFRSKVKLMAYIGNKE